MPFRIMGERGNEFRSSTRVQPASAVVLASRWHDEGVRNVRISDNAGRSYDLPNFRSRLVGRRSLYRAF